MIQISKYSDLKKNKVRDLVHNKVGINAFLYADYIYPRKGKVRRFRAVELYDGVRREPAGYFYSIKQVNAYLRTLQEGA